MQRPSRTIPCFVPGSSNATLTTSQPGRKIGGTTSRRRGTEKEKKKSPPKSFRLRRKAQKSPPQKQLACGRHKKYIFSPPPKARKRRPKCLCSPKWAAPNFFSRCGSQKRTCGEPHHAPPARGALRAVPTMYVRQHNVSPPILRPAPDQAPVSLYSNFFVVFSSHVSPILHPILLVSNKYCRQLPTISRRLVSCCLGVRIR